MNIRQITAKKVKDSRREETICVIVRTDRGRFFSSAPAGKSTGRHEIKSYVKDIDGDIRELNNLEIEKINKININKFEELSKVEKIISGKIGGNSLFALESSLIKAVAKEEGKELYEFLSGSAARLRNLKIRPVGNAVGGGVHSKGVNGKRPDFQEFLFIGDGKSVRESIKINNIAYKTAGKLLKGWRKKRNDEGAWESELTNEGVLDIMDRTREELKKKGLKVDIGLDIAASSFYKNKRYNYKNFSQELDKEEQIKYISWLVKRYNLFYVEDGMEEEDFSGFKELLKRVGRERCFIVGDDLTTTNPSRLMKAIRMKSINGIIVKPNQIGSLIAVKRVIEICRRYKIKTIISHRSGETTDDTIAELGAGFGCDFIKTGIYGRVRKAKLKRLIKIEKRVRG